MLQEKQGWLQQESGWETHYNHPAQEHEGRNGAYLSTALKTYSSTASDDYRWRKGEANRLSLSSPEKYPAIGLSSGAFSPVDTRHRPHGFRCVPSNFCSEQRNLQTGLYITTIVSSLCSKRTKTFPVHTYRLCRLLASLKHIFLTFMEHRNKQKKSGST